MTNISDFEELRIEQEKQVDQQLENWTSAGDIVLPSGNFAQVFWNIVNWKVAIELERKEIGGDRKIILQRAGKAITAENSEQARVKVDKLYSR